jgi:hypothetical protein
VWSAVVLIQTGIIESASVTARIAYIAVDATHAAAAEVYATLGVAFCMLEYTISMLSMSLRQAAVTTSSMVRVLLDCFIYLPAVRFILSTAKLASATYLCTHSAIRCGLHSMLREHIFSC